MLLNRKSILSLVLVFAVSAVLVGFGGADANGQEYPERTIKLVIPYGPGGATDAVFRSFAEYANKHLEYPLVVINMPGGSTTIGSRHAYGADPDGYTLFGGHNAMATTYVTGLVDFNYFDFEPIALVTSTPNIATINPDYNDWETMADVIEYAKENPGEVNWSASINSTDHFFFAELFDAIGEDPNIFNLVGMEGTGKQVTALLGGHTDGCMANVASAAGYIKAGELKFVGVAWHERLAAAPDVPTMDEIGITKFVNSTDRGLLAPKGTPDYVIEKIREIARLVCEDPGFIKVMDNMGILVNFKTGDDYIQFLKEDIAAKQGALKLIK